MSGEATKETVRRFYWKTARSNFGYHEDDLDEVCVDRLTGNVVVRYDLGDPANYDPAYGGWSHSEYLRRRGFDPDDRIAASDALVLSDNTP